MAQIEAGTPVRYKHGFDWHRGEVVDYLELHDAFEVRDDRTGEVRRVQVDKVKPLSKPRRMVGRVTRRGTSKRPPMRSVPKEPVWRSPLYLEHARSTGRRWGCPGCGTDKGIVAMHSGSDGGMSLKASDYYAIGACDPCHMRTHGKHQAFPGMTPEQTRLVIVERQNRTMAAWIARGEQAA